MIPTHISTDICFQPRALTGADVSCAMKKDLGFEAKYIEIRRKLKHSRFNLARHLSLIERIDGYPSVAVSDKSLKTFPEGQTFRSKRLAPHVDVLAWQTENQLPDEIIESIALQSPEFSAAYVHSWDDIFWQTEEQIAAYEEVNKPLPDDVEIVEHPIFGEAIDISKNPGRRTIFPGMLIQPSWKMWFGPRAFKYLPKRELLSFQNAYRVEERQGFVFVQLYKNLKDCAKTTSRARQLSFREHMKLDELISRADEIFEKDISRLWVEASKDDYSGFS